MKKILAIQLRQLGDILLTTPVLKALQQQGYHVTFLCHRMGLKFFEGHKDLPYHEIWTYREEDTLRQQVDLLKKIRQSKVTTVIDFMGNPRSAFYARISNASQRISWDTRRKWAYTTTVVRTGQRYVVDDKNRLLEAGGFRKSEDLKLFCPRLPSQKVTDYLTSFSPQQHRILLAPASRKKERLWSSQQFACLADHLARHWNARIMWIWGPGEKEFVEGIASLCKEKTYFIPQLSISELTELMYHSDLFIGLTNGPSHLAISAELPSLQLHGPTLAKAWNPHNNPQHCTIQAAPIDPQSKTLQETTYQDVLQHLNKMKSIIEERYQKRTSIPQLFSHDAQILESSPGHSAPV